MAQSLLLDLPEVTLNRESDGEQYSISQEGDPNIKTLDEDDIIGIIRVESDVQESSEYVLLYLSSKNSDEQRTNSSDLVLQKYRVKHLAPELSQFVLSLEGSPFLEGVQGQTELSVVVSVKSGACQAEIFYEKVLKDLLQILRITQDQYNVYLTDSESWIADFASKTLCVKASQGVAQSVLLLSGDGGIHDIVNGLFFMPQTTQYVKPKIGLLAFGTGNALANSSGVNADNTKGLRAVLLGRPHNIPTFHCKCSPRSVLLVDEARSTEDMKTDQAGNGEIHGAVVASWCLHASLVADSDTTEYRKFGSQRFSMAANALLAPPDGSPPHQWQGEVEEYHETTSGTDEVKNWERKTHMYLLATLVSNLEANLPISPHSKPLDGQLRLVDFPPLPSAEILQIFTAAYDGGKHIEHESVGYLEVAGFRVQLEETGPRWRRICIDGKIVRLPEHGWFEVRRETRQIADLMA